ncbi:MAG: type II toxin-antitoxin system HipA family toxin YjjJ [Bacteroidetes bacterium]|nr:type II toxin-antitoxin system HipA family toxin YjjJ [Bacteroidota bacterium]
MPELPDLLRSLGRGFRTSSALQEMLGVSQSTVSRLIAEAGERIIRTGARRSTRYAAARTLFDAGFALPLFEVDETGSARLLATLRGFANGGFFVDGDNLPAWLRGNEGNGVYPGLPYFLDDLRPAGFLGRLFARTVAPAWGFPDDPRLWNKEQLGRCLLQAGELLPGNIVMGEGAAGRLRIGQDERVLDAAAEYPRLAENVLAGEMPGSSAGGEQPKFTAWRETAGHLIVKFSSAGNNPEALRWRDLLRAEHHAQSALRGHGFPAAETRLVEAEGRVFLESVRFDRVGLHGRRPMISLAAVDAEFAGTGRDWSRSAAVLHARGLIDGETHTCIAALQAFGTAIGNTDMHLGNLSLAPEGNGFTLLPVYDMLPMALAPRHGDIPTALAPPAVDVLLPDSVRDAVREYRTRIAGDEHITSDFRRIIEE